MRPFKPRQQYIDAIDFQADGSNSKVALFKFFHPIHKKYLEISYGAFRNTINFSAIQLKDKVNANITLNHEGYAPVGFLANSSIGYLVHLLALVRLNLTPITLSPRNPVPIQVHLLKESKSPILFYEAAFQEQADQCAKELPGLKLIKVQEPNFGAEFFKVDPLVSLFQFQGNYSEHIPIILHSSGTTSYPKLIKLSNRYFVNMASNDPLHNESNVDYGNVLAVAPFFHTYGITVFTVAVNFSGTLSMPSGPQITPKSLINDSKMSNANMMILLPFFMKDLADYCDQVDQESWKYLSCLKSVHSAGAVLPIQLCERFKANNVTIVNGYGSTETAAIALNVIDKDTTNFGMFELSRSVKFRFHNRSGNITQIIIDKGHEGLATGLVPPGEGGFLIGDIFKIIEHNSEKNILKFEIMGRADDIIIHVSGEKTNPVPIESEISTNLYVKNCFVFGSGKLYNSIYIELNPKACEDIPVLKLTSSIFEQVENANAVNPSHSRIFPELVYILPFNTTKTIPITAKGNIVRKKCEDVFRSEIEELYEEFESNQRAEISSEDDEGVESEVFELSGIKSSISRCFNKATQKEFKSGKSFFKIGMDSLSAVKFRNLLVSKYPKLKIKITDIYEADTDDSLASFISDELSGVEKKAKSIEEYQQAVDQLLIEYTDFKSIKASKPQKKTQGSKMNVLITGANGSLGSFIIKALLMRPDIETVYGLARASSSEECLDRIKEGFRDRKIELSEDQWSRIVALPYTVDSPTFGLDESTFNKVSNDADIIYHVAWRMDFLKGVLSFKDCIESTVNLLKICASSPKRPSFHFTSTIGATTPVKTEVATKEEPLSTKLLNAEFCNGYNLSKLVSETLSHAWAREFNFDLDVYRVGQISGDTINGAWNIREHIPLLLKAAQVMGMAPANFGEGVAWIPVDTAANAMVEIGLSASSKHDGTTSHILNPKGFGWDVVFQGLRSTGIQFKVVENQEFIHTLRNVPKYQDVDINPIASLTDFFDNALTAVEKRVELETTKTCERSKFIYFCPPVDDTLIKRYVHHWTSNEFMDPILS